MSGMDAEQEMLMARTFAVSGYRAFGQVMKTDPPLPPWSALDEDHQNGFFRAVFVIHALTENADGTPWEEIARSAFECYRKALCTNGPPRRLDVTKDWADQELTIRLAWQAFARHVLGLFEAEELTEDAVEDMEAQWGPWAERKLREYVTV